MRKPTAFLVVLASLFVLAATSCRPMLAYWTPRHDYTLTSEDRRLIALIYGADFVGVIADNIYTKDLPYGAGTKGMYSIDAGEIWMNENAPFSMYDVIHEAVHYHQDNVRHRDLDTDDRPISIPDDLSRQLGAEQEAYLVQMYCMFCDGHSSIQLNGRYYSASRRAAFLSYIDAHIR